jgi:carboxyl-terminal processing protease
MNKSYKFFTVIIISVGLFISYAFVDNDFKIAKNLDIYVTLFKELNRAYVDDIDPEKLIKTSIDAMLESLDPYTAYIPESEREDFKFQITGQYGGIGALIRKNGDYAVIAEAYEKFPAQKAGLRAGDIILQIDGKPIKNKEVSDISEMLKGDPGTEVVVEIKRLGEIDNLKIKVKREKITIPNVPYSGMLNDTVGYIRLSGFTSDAGKDVRNALISLESKKAKSIILDLRNNPGGLLDEAVNVINVFVNKGHLIVSTKGKIKTVDKAYYTSDNAVDSVIPLAVMVNRSSASASEIVAGVIQDLDRGVIVGQRTFGKGLVQSTIELSYKTELKVTTAKYYIPSGRCIQALDYSHRNEDGSVGYVPDSLISEFSTLNGRKVYDGGGVMPDIKTYNKQLSNIAYSLYSKNFIFDYSTKYRLKYDSISNPKKFRFNDEAYMDFINFLQDKNFDYQTKSEENLKNLIEISQKEKYYDNCVEEFNSLKEKLAHDKNKDLITFKDEICELLEEEIVSRYHYQKGRIENTIVKDDEIAKAVKVLKNLKEYSDILAGYTGELSKERKNINHKKL